MKLAISYTYIYALTLWTVTASAQLVRFISPTPNSKISPGQQFTATVAFEDTTSSVDVIALIFGAKGNEPGEDDLGQTKLTVAIAPQFSDTGPQGEMVHDVQILLPNDMINGLNRSYNLTCVEFYTLGAENTPMTYTIQVPIFVPGAYGTLNG